MTLAEFSLNGWGSQDYYDISLVDGYNIQMSIKPKTVSAGSGDYWCKTAGCVADINRNCPQELQKLGKDGTVVACLSACEKFNQDSYCCRGSFGKPETCLPSYWPVNYPKLFKSACPAAYSYAYDDHTSTFFCKNTGYDIIFC